MRRWLARLQRVVAAGVAVVAGLGFLLSAALWAGSYWRHLKLSFERPLPDPQAAAIQPETSPLATQFRVGPSPAGSVETVDETIGAWASHGQAHLYWFNIVRISAISNPLSSWLPPPGYATRSPKWSAEAEDYTVPASGRPGFKFERTLPGKGVRRVSTVGVWFPLWAPTLLLSVPTLLTGRGIVRRLRRRRSRSGHFCESCGYDLRASPGRCPECGATADFSPPSDRMGLP